MAPIKFSQPSSCSSTPTKKSKRARTGCFTCRDRHIKCDERLPSCLNCLKGKRTCIRGVRLNFQNPTVHEIPRMMPESEPFSGFLDESLDIVKDYRGGLAKYRSELALWERDDSCYVPSSCGSAYEEVAFPIRSDGHSCWNGDCYSLQPQLQTPITRQNFGFSRTSSHYSPVLSSPRSTNVGTGTPMGLHLSPWGTNQNTWPGGQTWSSSHDSTSTSSTITKLTPSQSCLSEPNTEPVAVAPTILRSEEHDHLATFDEIRFMQAFVQGVGPWLEIFDRERLFIQHLPYRALKCNMLLKAILACGAQHLRNESAITYYDTARTELHCSIQNPDSERDMNAAVGVALTIYEALGGRHVAQNYGTHTWQLIKQSGWHGQSGGLGSACFWLTLGMNVFARLGLNSSDSSLASSDWDTTSAFDLESSDGDDHVWLRRILPLLLRSIDFSQRNRNRRHGPLQVGSPVADQACRFEQDTKQWQELKRLCDTWNAQCPRTMHTLGYVDAGCTSSRSSFPQVWLLTSTTTTARLLYHATMCVLSGAHPPQTNDMHQEIRFFELHHARQACGIVAHSTDRGVAALAKPLLGLVAPALRDEHEQAEVLQMLSDSRAMTVWSPRDVDRELREAWARNHDARQSGGLALGTPETLIGRYV